VKFVAGFVILLASLSCFASVFKTTMSPDGEFLVDEAAFGDLHAGRVSVFSVSASKQIFEKQLEFSASCILGSNLVVLQRYKLSIISMESGDEITHRLFDESVHLTGLDCNPTQNLIAFGKSQESLEIIDGNSLVTLKSFKVQSFPTINRYNLKFSPSGETLVVDGSGSSPIFFINTMKGDIRFPLKIYDSFAGIDFNYDESLTAVGLSGDHFIVVDTSNGSQKFESATTKKLGGVIPRFYKDKLLVAGTTNGNSYVKAFAVNNFSLIWSKDDFGNSVRSFDVSERLNRILIGSRDLFFLDPQNGIIKQSCYGAGKVWLFSKQANLALAPNDLKIINCEVL